MPVSWCELCLVFVVSWCCCTSAIEHKSKSVVFSYASASHPHVATLSHHYRAPPEPDRQQVPPPDQQFHRPTDQQLHQPPLDQNFHHPPPDQHFHQPPPHPYSHQPPDQHFHQPPGQHFHQSPPNQNFNQPPADPYFHQTSSDSNFRQPSPEQQFHQPLSGSGPHNNAAPNVFYSEQSSEQVPGGNVRSDGVSYDDHPDVIPSQIPQHEYPSLSPDSVGPSTMVYDNQQMDYPNHQSYPPHVNGHSPPPDLGYQSTPDYYNNRPPDNSPNIQPETYDYPDHLSTLGPNQPPEEEYSNPNRHHPPPSFGANIPDYTTPHPTYLYDYTVDHGSPTKFPLEAHHTSNKTHTYPSVNDFPDYQSPASPEFIDHHRPRGDKTFSPLPPSTTQIYYDENDYISTTPILEFESVKKLPSIEDYPLPNPGYISKPFKKITWRKNPDRQERLTRRPPKASPKTSLVHHSDKVLQKPKFFAYSSDLGEHDVLTHSPESEVKQSEESEDEEDGHKKKDEEHEKGGGQEHHSAHKNTAGDKGDKGYKSGHKHEEVKKGHHDKEDHKGKYLDEKGKKGKKDEEGGHYGEHHRAEKGKKAAKYGESGEHKKGHSTKGEHNIHKMDEYMKKHEFYDEHHEGGDHEKFGGFMEAHAHKKGGKKKKGHHKGGHHHKHKGKKGHHEKGHKLGHHKGHKDAKGYDGHFSKHKKYGKKGGSKKGKKWSYSKGSPPK